MISRKKILEAAIEGYEQKIKRARESIGLLKAELDGTPPTTNLPTPSKPKRKMSPARRAALLENLRKARAARATKRRGTQKKR
jgi:hypothetical protein